MSRRLLIIIGLALLIIIGAVAVVLFVDRNPSAQNAIYSLTNRTTNTANTNTAANTNRQTISPDTESIRFTARTFVERYGSFSNQSDGNNLRAAADYATATYAAALRSQADSTTPDTASAYHGVTSRVVTFTTVSQTSTAATLTVGVQQTVIDGATTSTITKDILIDEVKTNDGWRVNAAVWK